MCVDLRYVNQGTIDDKYPMKRVDEILSKYSRADLLTTLDAVQGYYQIPMQAESIPYTAFVTHRGQYENVYMPFGLKCASQTFQRALDKILNPVRDCAGSYIDDICCHSKGDVSNHLYNLKRVLTVIRDAGLTLKLKKCKFLHKCINFVGFVIGGGVIKPNPEKVRALSLLKEPESKKQVRSVLGMFQYYHHHIPNFSMIALPLTEMTKKRCSNLFFLNDEQRNAFNTLKRALLDAVDLYSPRMDKPFVVHSDASEAVIAGCLSQRDENGKEVPISFVSKKLTDTQRRWSVIEKEAYAILYCLNQFDYYIYGNEVELYTDHNPLTYLTESAPKSAKLTRWCLGLQRWKVKLKYKKSKDNVVADCLTRV